LGNDGNYFLIGASLYTQGNVWGIAVPPEDWKLAGQVASVACSPPADAPKVIANKKVWPYNLFTEGAEAHPGRK
jgi:hypothetical protein